MKIVHICMGFPIEYPGGITNYVRELANSQSKYHSVTVFCNGDVNAFSEEFLFKIKRYNSIIKNFTLNLDEKDDDYIDFFKMLKGEGADVYHFHSLLGIDLRFLDVWDIKNYVVSLHDYNTICPRISMVQKNDNVCTSVDLEKCELCVGQLEQISILQRISNKLKIELPAIKAKNVSRRYGSFINFLNNSACTFPVSNRVSEIFIRSGLDNNKCKVLTIGNRTACYFEKRYPTQTPKIKIAFMGNFIKIKGADLFVEFLENSKLEKFEFHLYGRGDKSIIEKFINLGGVYHGSYNPADIKLILKDIDIGAVLPLWEDNGPQVVMEFINNGIPVLGTSKGGISDFIITNENGFLFDPDKNKFAAFEWLKSIDKTILSELMNGITPLKTPEQHAKELELEYLKMMDNFN